jgi:hypothetical protein
VSNQQTLLQVSVSLWCPSTLLLLSPSHCHPFLELVQEKDLVSHTSLNLPVVRFQSLVLNWFLNPDPQLHTFMGP